MRKGRNRHNVRQPYRAAIERIDRGLDAVARYGYGSFMACGRKRRYKNRTDAENVARLRMMDGAPPLRAYYCPHCNGWHLTKRQVWVEQGERCDGPCDGTVDLCGPEDKGVAQG